MHHLASKVCHRREQFRRHLALYAGIPGVLLHGLQIRRHGQVRSIRTKYRILPIEKKWVRIAAGIIHPWIIQTDPATNDRQPERRNGRLVLDESLRNEVLGNSSAD